MRPIGVSLVGFYQILRGLVGLVFGFFVLFFDGPANKLVSVAALGNGAERLVGHFGHGGGLPIIAFAFVHMLAAFGVLQLRSWGRYLTLLFSAIELVLVLPSALHTNVFALLVGGLNGLCILYLAMPPVGRAFRVKYLGANRLGDSAARA
jgi:hypothetical protein